MPAEALGVAAAKEVSESPGSCDRPVIAAECLTRFARAREAGGALTKPEVHRA